MMSVAPVASAGGAAGYYSHSDNYYFLGELESVWLGDGAAALGLEGKVRSDALTAVLEGRLPDGSRLGREVSGKHVHRPGHDLTFSAPKSVSILALVGGDKAMVEAHNHAVQVAAGYVEKLISARDTRDGVTSIVHTGKMVAAAFTHDTSRNLDPQLHTHLLIANMTEQDGKWKALATDYIHNAGFIETVMKMQVTLGKIYRSALRQRVEALGHEVEEVGKHGMWEIKGVPAPVREEFSSRGREIQGAIGAEATLRSRDVAAKDTRQAKVDPSRLRLMERWLGQMKEQGYDLKAYQDSVVPPAKDVIRPAPGEPEPEKNQPPLPETEKANLMPHNPDKLKEAARPAAREALTEKSAPEAELFVQRGNRGLVQPARAVVADRTNAAPEVMEAVRMAISQLSDSKTRFTFGELLLTTAELSEQLPAMDTLRAAIDAQLKEGAIVPLDQEKGVFISRIHLLDELSIQALSQEHLKSTTVVSFIRPAQYAPPALEVVEKDALVLMNAPSGVASIRDLTAQLTGISTANGRDVQVLASSAERAISLAKSDNLRERIISRQHVLSGDFHLKPQSTLIIEGAERLGLKETLVLLGEARAQDAQLVFLDSAGRQANGNAMSVLESAGVTRSRRTEPAPGLEAEVLSIPNKRDRYEALAVRFAELTGGPDEVTAVVIGQREQKQLTGLIRNALQNAGQLSREEVEVEARSPVWLDSKTRRMPGSYRAGMVLEDRSDAKSRRAYVIDRVHEDTRMLSLVDSDGVLSRMKISELGADWRLFNSEMLQVGAGDHLLAVAADRGHNLKAKDRLIVTDASDAGLLVTRNGKTLTLPTDQPLYLTHGYVSAPGGRDNDQGVVLAALNSRDITAQTMNSLAQSGHRAEVFTAEDADRVEGRLRRMKTNASPVRLVRSLSGKEDVSEAVSSLKDSVRSAAGLAVWRAINDQRHITFSELKLASEAEKFHPDFEQISQEIDAMASAGELLRVSVRGEPMMVPLSAWEMEKAILREVDAGKNTQAPLLAQVPADVLAGLTDGQKAATELVLGSTDRFIGIQGYAGVGKTTQVKAVAAALAILPAEARPVLNGLAPTHQAVKEMRDVGVRAQTIKSFIVEHDQATAAGEKPDYQGQVFLIDESSMAGNQDTAALFQAIAAGGGRAVSMGDIDQFEAVDAGAPFKLMQERSPMDVAIMKEIVRQKDVQLRGAVHDIIDNRIGAALKRIEAQPVDRIPRETGAQVPLSAFHETQTPVEDIVRDWTGRTLDARARTLIITQVHADRRAVNEGIHAALAARGELGQEAVTVPVLDKISHTRHEFNKTEAWEPGMVVKRGDRYQDVLAVDRNGSTVTVRDEDGKTGLYSPRELITGDVQLFRRNHLEVRTGDLLGFNVTDREQGQTANQRFTVESVTAAGELRLRGDRGTVTINPKDVRAQQHIDYAWAVTGYGAQGTSSDYVISLEGTDAGRKALATRRAFYISASRVREHVQIYTDGKEDWTKSVLTPEKEIKTVHDALRPETQRQQAKAIWAMGQPVTKTAIGRAWSRHESLGQHSLTGRIIPATRRFPEPALALPVYDDNGKSAGLALISITPGENGQLARGETRMVTTDKATGVLVQRSRNGNTLVVSSANEALKAVREHPEDGVIWQTGTQKPSPWMIKVSRGTEQSEEARNVRLLKNNREEIRIPVPEAQAATEYVPSRAVEKASDELEQIGRSEKAQAQRQQLIMSRDAELRNAVRLPVTSSPEIYIPSEEPTTSAAGFKPSDSAVARIAGQERENHTLQQTKVSLPEMDRNNLTEERASSARIAGQLVENERVILPSRDLTEQGRALEHQEPTRPHTIQKER